MKSKIGIGLVIVGFLCPVFGLLVPFLGLDSTTTTALVAFLMVGGPEVFFVLGGLLAGKEGVLLVKNKIKKFIGLPEGEYPASKTQYKIGVALILVWFPLTLVAGYVPNLFDFPLIKENLFWIALAGDITLVVAIFGLGGHQMITKIGSVFKWEQWELPNRN
ncbi:transporter suffix domain-containing protein [Flammeovirga aprica]|uniref:Transporter suffix domain-containing protein n=1 Tax=Flammeovirga aprica JL-4 TaxID=694437 RepID=A0A7X9S0H2_9BACT|nr:transporter suffix domain-containing protein [Flammeovirga aprica]NME72081.1 transporter suffix domain-containing protein [Flammeovirga aprica JL-4]